MHSSSTSLAQHNICFEILSYSFFDILKKIATQLFAYSLNHVLIVLLDWTGNSCCHDSLGQGNWQIRFPSTFFKNLMRQFFIIHYFHSNHSFVLKVRKNWWNRIKANGTKRVVIRPKPASFFPATTKSLFFFLGQVFVFSKNLMKFHET